MAKTYYFRSVDTGRVFETSRPEYHRNDIPMAQKAGQAAMSQQAKTNLLEYIEPGQTIYCSVLSVSESGASRSIKLFAIVGGKLVNITYNVSRLLGHRMAKNGGVAVVGGNMDMCFNTVYELGYALFRGTTDKDAGYSLTHETI